MLKTTGFCTYVKIRSFFSLYLLYLNYILIFVLNKDINMRDKDNKGELNGKCNTSCQKPNSTWYNHSTQKYYCALVQKKVE
jgi:hypothetical protein